MMFFRRLSPDVLLSILLLAGASVLGGCGSGGGAKGVEITNPRLMQTPGGQRAFTGTLVNTGSQPISIAQVEVALYDDSGSEIETIRIEVEDIPAQDSLDFSGTIDSDRAFSQAQVKSVMTP